MYVHVSGVQAGPVSQSISSMLASSYNETPLFNG